MSALPLRALAPAKINLGLFLGPVREDGKHELVTVMQSISLADELTLELADADPAVGVTREETVGETGRPEAGLDEVVCPGVSGPAARNLAALALAAFRDATGWDAPPLRLSIHKRIPVAAGLGGGSADAAAALRLAAHASGLGGEALLHELGTALGADVPAQIEPGRWLATGAGERLERLPDPTPSFGVLVLPAVGGLSTATVYAEADRLGLLRSPAALESRRGALHAALDFGVSVVHGDGAEQLLRNDLQPAALVLCPAIEDALNQAREAGADLAMVSGSGPTVVGLFLRSNSLGRAERAAAGLDGRAPAPIVAEPVDAAFARVHAGSR
jgi:4-diphosphocytidyl-2-C-methyl-D-erythritol kinase